MDGTVDNARRVAAGVTLVASARMEFIGLFDVKLVNMMRGCEFFLIFKMRMA